METQRIEHIKIADLVLWTENPRDPISTQSNDQDILNIALGEHHSKWELKKLAEQMGDTYDFSELPTVVYHGKIPVVYDGNRRVLLGKIQKKFVSHELVLKWKLPLFPDEIPCNVCEKKVALANVLRKHGDSGSWLPLERDIFLHRHMKYDKSPFLIIEEQTNMISQHSHLNQRFVKDEILTSERLKELGFEINGEILNSRHSKADSTNILNDLSEKIRTKEISTRKNRGKIYDVLEPDIRQLIDADCKKPLSSFSSTSKTQTATSTPITRQTKRTQNKSKTLFREKLYLKNGVVNDLYRDVQDLYFYYCENNKTLSESFASLIRMALRLLCETASKDLKFKKIDLFINQYFEEAKASLDSNEQTTLSTQNVVKTNLPQLLHVGAHNYDASNNIGQTLAIGLILGAMLTISHGKKQDTP